VIRLTSLSLNGYSQLKALFLSKLLLFGSLSAVDFLFCCHYFFVFGARLLLTSAFALEYWEYLLLL